MCSAWVRLLATFIPFTAERLWKELGGEGLVSFAAWPEPAEERVDGALEISEELLARTVEDIESILKLIQLKPKAITIAIAPEWFRNGKPVRLMKGRIYGHPDRQTGL